MSGSNMPWTWRSAALSRCGTRRRQNQDACLDRPDVGLWAVADGIGGHSAGHVASQALCRALGRVPAADSLVELSGAVEAAVTATNRYLRTLGATVRPPTVIGTTTAVLFIHSGYAMCAWCGDSRVHLVRRREAFLLTRDHTPVRDMLDRGEIDHGAARDHKDANVVSRAIGVSGDAGVDRVAVEPRAGDRFLLCTDGVNRHVGTAELAGLAGASPRRMVRNVVELAQARGATDDVTAVAVSLVAGTPAG